MRRVSGRAVRRLGLVLSAALLGCAMPVEGDSVESRGESLFGGLPIAFTPIEDPSILPSEGEVRQVITSAWQYERLFGHAPPGEVDFRAGDILVYYSAGIRLTGGFAAKIKSIELHLGQLEITTWLSSPGENCGVTQALSHPYALVKLRPPPVLFFVTFDHYDVVGDCEALRTCDDITCPLGQHCELADVWCVRAPCPAQPACFPDAQEGDFRRLSP